MKKANTQVLYFNKLLEEYNLPLPTQEYKFYPTRRWRFDYAWIEQKVALEVEGGVATYGRHVRISGFVSDLEKYNTATILGWRIIRVLPQQLLTYDKCIKYLIDLLKGN